MNEAKVAVTDDQAMNEALADFGFGIIAMFEEEKARQEATK
jgi:hypothetical protein